ncbi:MAG TPA: hypothetical protein VL832_28285 [Puia sp.]|jgi:hypothetical protein|nr:hypothetical protein [Puia sp.]
MKKIAPFLFASLFMLSCSVQFVAPKGNYPKPPIAYHSNKPVDKVWDNLIDVFAQNGLSIKIIDKSSGLIVSERKSLSFTVEDKKGKIKNPSAFVIMPRITYEGFDDAILPYHVYGEWNVRIKAEGQGTLININLLNFNADYGDPKSENSLYYQKLRRKYQGSLDGQTTGIFENIIATSIK